MFWLKKVVSYWLMPLPLCMALLATGLLVMGFTRRKRLGSGLVLSAAALLFLFSSRFVSMGLLRPLEATYPAIAEVSADGAVPASLKGCKFIAVLGSGNSRISALPAISRLSASGLGRITEAVRLLRLLPEARLIVSGPGAPGNPSHASILGKAAVSLGIDPRRIIYVETARDTEDESLLVARIVGRARTGLVTSAWHMPRAALLFKRAGVDYVPCPADFVSYTRSGSVSQWESLGFDSEALERSTLAVHERIGLLWLKVRPGL